MRMLTWAVLVLSAAASAPPERSVDQAILRVYPALVQIRALALDHTGGRELKHEISGSGVIISPEGYVVTNHHVAGKTSSLRVTLSSREELEAELVGTDALADIAVIRLDLKSRRPGALPLVAAKFGSSSALKVGDTVLAMGCPLALSHSVTEGIVANKDMMLPRELAGRFTLDGEDVGSLVKWIGHDAAIQPGNSGGPLVDLGGEVVGINEIGLGSMSGAIPSELAQQVARELISHGKVKRSWIGAEFQPLLKRHELVNPDARGVLVAGVVRGRAADAAGLKAGDLVLDVDGTPVTARFREELPAFNSLVLGKPVGEPLRMRVLRGQKELSLTVKTMPREDAAGRQTEAREWGLAVEPLTPALQIELQRPDTRGVLISSVRPGGPGDQASPPLQRRDVILEVGGAPTADLEGLAARTRSIVRGKDAPVPTLVLVERRNERLLSLVEVGLRTPQTPAGELRKAWLPVTTQVLTRKLAAALGLKGKKGVRITQVFPGSSAEAAGFRVGDLVTHIDGNVIEASEPHDGEVFDAMIRAYPRGAKAEFTVVREGKPAAVSAVLEQGPAPARDMRVYEDAQLEFRARDVSVFDRIGQRWPAGQGGALVAQVEAGGWAAVGGLREDDLITSVDGQPVAALDDLETQLKAAGKRKVKQIVLLVQRGVHTLFVELEPKWQ